MWRRQSCLLDWFHTGNMEGGMDPEGSRQSETHRRSVDHSLHCKCANISRCQLLQFPLVGRSFDESHTF